MRLIIILKLFLFVRSRATIGHDTGHATICHQSTGWEHWHSFSSDARQRFKKDFHRKSCELNGGSYCM